MSTRKIILYIIATLTAITIITLSIALAVSYSEYRKAILQYKPAFDQYIKQYELAIPESQYMQRLGYFV